MKFEVPAPVRTGVDRQRAHLRESPARGVWKAQARGPLVASDNVPRTSNAPPSFVTGTVSRSFADRAARSRFRDEWRIYRDGEVRVLPVDPRSARDDADVSREKKWSPDMLAMRMRTRRHGFDKASRQCDVDVGAIGTSRRVRRFPHAATVPTAPAEHTNRELAAQQATVRWTTQPGSRWTRGRSDGPRPAAECAFASASATGHLR
jgi:hypothetical protein